MLDRAALRLRSIVAALFRRDALDQAMDDEFELHLALRADDLVRRGMARDDAVRLARLEFGNVTGAKESARTSWGTAWVDRLGQDLHFALRTLRRNPGFTVVAVLSLGFGIGATTTVFSVIDALDFRPLPFREPDRLVWLSEVTPRDHELCSRCPFFSASPTVRDWAAQARSFDAMEAMATSGFSWEHDDVSESLNAAQASPGFFRLLGVRPLLGRDFAFSDTASGAEPVALVSYEFWQTRLGGDANVVGSRLASRGAQTVRSVTVVGVLPEHVRFKSDAPIWTPLTLDAGSSRTGRELKVVARLSHEQSIAGANAELATISARLALAYPAAYRGWDASVLPLRDLLTTGAAKSRFVLFAITMLVLFIAVLNVTGLLLGRAVARQQEFAMRSALGATRARLLRQLLVEGSCLGLAGGLLGIGLAVWAVRFVPRWFSIDSAGLTVGVDHRMLAFAAAVSAIVGVGAAVAPGLRAASTSGTLRTRPGDAGAGAARASNALITLQIALALVLLTTAGLLSRDFVELRYLDLGYDPSGLYRTSLSGTREQSANPAAWGVTVAAARARIAAIPGVVSVTLEHQSAMHPEIVRPDVEAGSIRSPHTPVVKAIDPAYFATFGTRLLSGRPFTAADDRGAPLVAIVNKAAAERFWPGRSAIGRRVFVGDSASAGELLTVIGVAANAERGELFERHWPMVYRPFVQASIYHAAAGLYVRVGANTPELFAAAQAAIRQATGRAPSPFASDEERLGRRMSARQLNAIVLDLFAGFGLLLAAMGIYGSVAYTVTQRTREIGIRIALGAERQSVVGLVARRGVLLAIGGVSVGFAGVFASTRVLRSFMLGTSVTNPWVFVVSSSLMIGVALAAAYVPARRATRVDAMIALRAE